MLYQKMNVKDGKLEVVESKVVDQSTLTSECWMIQIEGLKACETCEFRDTKECGGKKLRKRLTSQE